MPFSDDHAAITNAIGAMRSGHNPDGRQSGEMQMAPDIWQRMMRGEITPHEARREWAEREPGARAFNNELRRQAGIGFVADAEQVLSQAGTEGAPVTARDAQTGRFADLDDAMREAGHKPMDANSQIRAEYERVVARREERS